MTSRLATLANHSRVVYAIMAVLLLVSAFLLMRNIGQPWSAKIDGDGGGFSTIAANYIRYGPWNLHFGQAVTPRSVSDTRDLRYYQHHPPLMPLLVAGSFRLFGESEASARLVPVVFTLGSILLTFALARRLYADEVALLAMGCFATLPAILYFGRKVGYEAPTLFFILLSLWAYLNYLEARQRRGLLVFMGAMVAGLMTDWPAYLLVPALMLHYTMHASTSRIVNPVVLGLPVLSLLTLTMFAYSTFLAAPESVSSVLYQGMAYMGLIPKDSPLAATYYEAAITFTPTQFVKQTLVRMDALYGYPVLLLGLFGVWYARRWRGTAETLVWVLAFVALGYCIIFYRSVFIHIWHTYYLSVPVALLGALAAQKLFFATGKIQVGIPLFFVIALIFAGAAPRLLDLHTLQIRLLPGEQHEKSDFLKAVALNIRSRSFQDDIVVSSLPDNAQKIIAYYAQREVAFGAVALPPLKEAIARWGIKPSRIHYLYWIHQNPGPPPASAEHELLERSEFEVQGHRFVWLTYRGQS